MHVRSLLCEFCELSASSAVKSFFIVLLVCPVLFAQAYPGIPPEVLHKYGYISSVPTPSDFTSAMLWGIAIADTRVPRYQAAQVEIASTALSCRVDGKEVVLNDDLGNLRGGLFQRHPWFASDVHDPISVEYSRDHNSVILRVGKKPDRVWHFWAASPRAQLPRGHLEGCTVRIRAQISSGALLQVGMDYWRNTTVDYGFGGNNREAGASNWYFPSDQWQQATFTDIHSAH